MSRRLLVRDQRGERERLLVGTMTVGRDTRCDISDADPLLSRRHAEFVCRPDSLVVRDLNSRNGIVVNGVKVQEAVLRPGDVVKVARLIMTYLGDTESARPSSTSGGADGASAHLRAARTERIGSAGREGPSAPDLDPQDERTRVVPRLAAPLTTPPGQVAVARMTPPAMPPPAEPPAREPPHVDSDGTRPMIRESEVKTATPVLPRSALAAAPAPIIGPAVEWPPVSAQPPAPAPLEDWSLELRPPQVDRPSPHPGASPRGGAPAEAAVSPHAGAPSSSPDALVLLGCLSLTVVAFTLAAAPTLIWHGQTVESAATTQAVGVARAFAAEAGSALQRRGASGLGPVAERAREENGVVSAVVMWADGRVAASANPAAPRVTLIPGLKMPPDAVQEALTGARDGLIDAAAPVRASDGSRAAVVWVTIRRAPSLPLGMVIVILGPSLLVALLAGSLLAWWLRRVTTGGPPAVR
jgi:hypothetical protein